MRGNGWLRLRNGIWQAVFCINGRRIRESTGTSDRKQAQKFLDARIKEKHVAEATGQAFMRRVDKTRTIADLAQDLLNNFKIRKMASQPTCANIKRLVCDLGHVRAASLKSQDIDRYIFERQQQGSAPASINRCLSMLRQSYKLANLLPPRITRLAEHNARSGFYSESEIRAIISNLPGDLQDFTLFGWLTGMRKSEIKSLRWENVDGDVLRLEGKDAKTREPRMIPLEGELADLIERRRQARLVKRNDVTELSPLIFHRDDGRPVGRFGVCWPKALRKAGAPAGRLFHDLRRSAARNMIRAGVPQSVCMKITGHRTIAIFQRYAIVAEGDLREALKRTQAYTPSETTNVVAMPAPNREGSQTGSHLDLPTPRVASK